MKFFNKKRTESPDHQKSSKPEVILTNQENVYKHYETRKKTPRATKVGQFLMSMAMRPKIHISDQTRRAVHDHLENEGRVLYVANHIKWQDPLVLATAMRRVRELKRTRINTLGIVKPSLLQNSNFSWTKKGMLSLLNPLLRWGVEKMDSIPAFRLKDTLDKNGQRIPGTKRLLGEAGLNLTRISVKRIEDGGNVAMFPEGTRNKSENPHIVQELEAAGVGRIALGGYSASDGNFAVLPLSIYYGKSKLRPHLVIGDMVHVDGLSQKEVVPLIHDAMQQGVNQAVTNYNAHQLQ